MTQEKEQQEIMFKLNMFEQQIQYFQQQLQAIEQGIVEMNSLNLGLDELVGSEGKEILASVGKRIFIKTKIISEELTVDIGEGTLVKKTIPETKEIIIQQIKKLEEVKKELEENLEKINKELTETIIEAQKNN